MAHPLPDPVAIKLGAIPESVPPYDDRRPGMPQGARHSDADVFAATVVAALRAGPGAGGPEAGRSGAGGTGAGGTGAGGADGGSGQVRRLVPGQAGWPSKFAQVLAETLAGSRPPAQLTPWTTERARSHIRKLGPMLMGAQRPVVRRIVTSQPASGVMEMSVVVGFGPRVHALAIRLEREREQPPSPGRPGRRARWMCTTVEAA
jgi:hypothetical protein